MGSAWRLEAHGSGWAARTAGLDEEDNLQARGSAARERAEVAVVGFGVQVHAAKSDTSDEALAGIHTLGLSDREIADGIADAIRTVMTGAFSLVGGLSPAVIDGRLDANTP